MDRRGSAGWFFHSVWYCLGYRPGGLTGLGCVRRCTRRQWVPAGTQLEPSPRTLRVVPTSPLHGARASHGMVREASRAQNREAAAVGEGGPPAGEGPRSCAEGGVRARSVRPGAGGAGPGKGFSVEEWPEQRHRCRSPGQPGAASRCLSWASGAGPSWPVPRKSCGCASCWPGGAVGLLRLYLSSLQRAGGTEPGGTAPDESCRGRESAVAAGRG